MDWGSVFCPPPITGCTRTFPSVGREGLGRKTTLEPMPPVQCLREIDPRWKKLTILSYIRSDRSAGEYSSYNLFSFCLNYNLTISWLFYVQTVFKVGELFPKFVWKICNLSLNPLLDLLIYASISDISSQLPYEKFKYDGTKYIHIFDVTVPYINHKSSFYVTHVLFCNVIIITCI